MGSRCNETMEVNHRSCRIGRPSHSRSGSPHLRLCDVYYPIRGFRFMIQFEERRSASCQACIRTLAVLDISQRSTHMWEQHKSSSYNEGSSYYSTKASIAVCLLNVQDQASETATPHQLTLSTFPSILQTLTPSPPSVPTRRPFSSPNRRSRPSSHRRPTRPRLFAPQRPNIPIPNIPTSKPPRGWPTRRSFLRFANT